jgi:hypothetical protein
MVPSSGSKTSAVYLGQRAMLTGEVGLLRSARSGRGKFGSTSAAPTVLALWRN